MTRGLTFQEDGFYHVYNRGTEKREIFSREIDYERFVILLYLANSKESLHFQDYRGSTSIELFDLERAESLVDICAYCLMPNHFHLLLREHTQNGISKFMHKLSTSYTMYFNTRYERTGALFQGRFKAQDANKDQYLKYLISYIHLNPIKLLEPRWKEEGISNFKKAEKFLQGYSYSSYLDYLGRQRVECQILNKDALPDYFESPKNLRDTMFEWLQYKNS